MKNELGYFAAVAEWSSKQQMQAEMTKDKKILDVYLLSSATWSIPTEAFLLWVLWESLDYLKLLRNEIKNAKYQTQLEIVAAQFWNCSPISAANLLFSLEEYYYYTVRLTSIEVTKFLYIYLDVDMSNWNFCHYHAIHKKVVYCVVMAEFLIGQIVVEISLQEGQRALNSYFKIPNLARA